MNLVPGPIRDLAKGQGGPTAAMLIVLGITVPQAGIGAWSILAIGGGTLLTLTVELWVRSDRFEKRVRELEESQVGYDDLAGRVQDLEAEVLRLREERRELKERLKSPRASAQQLLAALGEAMREIETVKRHRALGSAGLAQLAATVIELSSDDGYVEVECRALVAADPLLREPVVLESVGGGPVAVGQVVTVSGMEARATFKLAAFPDVLGAVVLDEGKLEPDGYSVRPLGLAQPVGLTDDELDEVRERLEGSATALVRLSLSGPESHTSLGEDENEER